MPVRFIPLVNGEYYHIYNRGSGRQPVFLNKIDYQRFILTLSYYRFLDPKIKLSRLSILPNVKRKAFIENLESNGKKQIEILSYVLMPNHFHFLLKQINQNGISNFMRLAINSWSHYFNKKYNRPGSLFQGAFKAVHIESEEQLIHLSRYIHLNPLVSHVVREKDFLSYPWSSLSDYLQGKSQLVELESILSLFKSPQDYKKFITDHIGYARELQKIKHLILDQ